MGQRSQIILIVDGVNYGNDNSNDNNGSIYISHNQWRYGVNAIYVLKHLLDKYNKIVEKWGHGDNYFFSSIAREFDSCLRYAENHSINYGLTQSHPFEDYTKQFYEFNKSVFTPVAFLEKYTDNNNGWFVIRVYKDKSIGIGILNGYEDSDEIKQRTFKGYCRLFSANLDKEDEKNIRELELYKKIDVFDEFGKFFNQIKSDFKKKKVV